MPALTGSKMPRIIFTSSGVALTGRAFWGAYAISKAATKSMAEIFKEELEGTQGFNLPKLIQEDSKSLLGVKSLILMVVTNSQFKAMWMKSP